MSSIAFYFYGMFIGALAGGCLTFVLTVACYESSKPSKMSQKVVDLNTLQENETFLVRVSKVQASVSN